MTGTSTLDAPLIVAPSSDPTPVQRAVVDSLLDDHPPETFLWIVFHRADGGARIWYAWTAGGQPLGDRIDQLALGAGLDASDWLHIGDRHAAHSERGRIRVQAYALRPVLADVQAGERSPEDRREGIRRIIRTAATMTGQTPRTLAPTWLGFGPVLVNRKASA
ncbi:hypothetical protein ACIP9H_33925 [Streptomyces sp. NPDC088732]|uniref:hypothetical protein n=1 Tax=Streptomyces sp. NPDC088732 TaxID=3365879 RepID=UPI0038222590